jgi:hypothetical protein
MDLLLLLRNQDYDGWNHLGPSFLTAPKSSSSISFSGCFEEI